MFNGLAVLSLVLCVATTAVIWPLSCYYPMWWSSSQPGRNDLMISRAGVFRVDHETQLPGDFSQGSWASIVPDGIHNYGPPSLRLERMTIMRWKVQAGESRIVVPSPASRMVVHGWTWRLRCDYWLMSLLFAVLPAARLFLHHHRRHHRRLMAGLCRACSYDLTGNVSGVCPECGTPISEKAK
jgi:hypothetical protein